MQQATGLQIKDYDITNGVLNTDQIQKGVIDV